MLIGIIPCFLAAWINPRVAGPGCDGALRGTKKALKSMADGNDCKLSDLQLKLCFPSPQQAGISRETGGAERHFFPAGVWSVNHGLIPSGHFPQFISNFLSPSKYFMLVVGCWRVFPSGYMDFSGLYTIP